MQQGAWKRTNICRWCCIQIIPSTIKILEWNERSGSSQLVDDFWRIQGTDNVCHAANYCHCVSRKEKLIQDLDLLLLSLLCAHVTSIIHCNHNRSHFSAEARQLSNNKCKSITFVKIFIHIQWSRTGRNYIRHVSDFVIFFFISAHARRRCWIILCCTEAKLSSIFILYSMHSLDFSHAHLELEINDYPLTVGCMHAKCGYYLHSTYFYTPWKMTLEKIYVKISR